MTGYIQFDSEVDGNWHADRMVQLVLVGPESDGERQHIIASCGQVSADPPAPRSGCL